MPAHKIQIAPELIAEGKRLYEQTLTLTSDIAAMKGICRETLNDRIREWRWKRHTRGTGGSTYSTLSAARWRLQQPPRHGRPGPMLCRCRSSNVPRSLFAFKT